MTQQEAYKILGITEEEIEAAGAVPEGTKAAGASTETSQSFDNAFQNFNRQAVERLIKKKYRQRILSAHPDVQPEEDGIQCAAVKLCVCVFEKERLV